ncbi:glycosyltransferase family 4 protein [Candidatus Omnitrophota bacterium]
MRVLYIANRSEIFGGGQISLIELLSRLDRSRFEPMVLCPGEGGLSEKVKALNIPALFWEMPTARTINLFKTAEKVRELRSIILENNVDIIHANGSRAQFYSSLAVKGTGAKLIWHVRESTPDRWLYDWFIGNSARRIICVSQGAKEKRFGHFPSLDPKLRVVYNGVDTQRFKKDPGSRRSVREDLGVGDDDILLGHIGLLTRQKGHQILLKAISILAGNNPNIKLLIMGKTIDVAYVKRLTTMTKQLGLDDNIIFSEPREDVEATLSALDIFILPSEREGFSRALIEAMSSSLPIIASDVEGNNEAIIHEETGFLVPYGDVYLLAEDIQKLLKDRNMSEKMGQNARKRVEKRFNIETHVSAIQELYEEIFKN